MVAPATVAVLIVKRAAVMHANVRATVAVLRRKSNNCGWPLERYIFKKGMFPFQSYNYFL